MQAIRAIIIDDEEKAIITLAAMFGKFFNQVELAGTATNGRDGLKLISSCTTDVLFLDVNMPEMDGLEMLEQMEVKDFKTVITSAHEKYALKAIRHKVYDYLLKPIHLDELERVINAIDAERVMKNVTPFIKLSDKKGMVHVKPDDIHYVKADGRYSEVNCIRHKKYFVSKNIGELEEELKLFSFFRVHKSYLVNCKHINHIQVENEGIILDNGTTIELSRRKKAEFLTFLNQNGR